VEEIAGPAKNQMWADMGKRVPAGRIAKPADIAKAYSFLLGSELTNGIVLKIDGGHAWSETARHPFRSIGKVKRK
jgi:NAD(P)-dependent dehydrogenase (short-subunit alcohol dehydrogenase family)